MGEVKNQEIVRVSEYISFLVQAVEEKKKKAEEYDEETRENVAAHAKYFLELLKRISLETRKTITTPEQLIQALNAIREQDEPPFLGPEDELILKEDVSQRRVFKIVKIYRQMTEIPPEELEKYQSLPGTNFWDRPPDSINGRTIPGVYLLEKPS